LGIDLTFDNENALQLCAGSSRVKVFDFHCNGATMSLCNALCPIALASAYIYTF